MTRLVLLRVCEVFWFDWFGFWVSRFWVSVIVCWRSVVVVVLETEQIRRRISAADVGRYPPFVADPDWTLFAVAILV